MGVRFFQLSENLGSWTQKTCRELDLLRNVLWFQKSR